MWIFCHTENRFSVDAGQLVLDRVSHHRCGRAQLEFLLEIVAMRLCGLDADAESLRALLGGRTLGYQLQYFALTPSRTRRAGPIRSPAIARPREHDRGDCGAQVLPPRVNRAHRA